MGNKGRLEPCRMWRRMTSSIVKPNSLRSSATLVGSIKRFLGEKLGECRFCAGKCVNLEAFSRKPGDDIFMLPRRHVRNTDSLLLSRTASTQRRRTAFLMCQTQAGTGPGCRCTVLRHELNRLNKWRPTTRLYGLVETHKMYVTLRLIVSTINSLTYSLTSMWIFSWSRTALFWRHETLYQE